MEESLLRDGKARAAPSVLTTAVTPLQDEVNATPLRKSVCLVVDDELHDTRDGDAYRECGCEDVRVFRPPRKEAPADIVVEENGGVEKRSIVRWSR